MPGFVMNLLEDRVREAKSRDNIEAAIEEINAGKVIEGFKGPIRMMVSYMGREYNSVFANCILLSNGLQAKNPAVTKPQDETFSFEFKPRTFDLGLTGRLLEGSAGKRFQESLSVECDIYDAYNLAVELLPQSIIARDASGNQTVVYESYAAIGKQEIIERPTESFIYVFSEGRLENYRHSGHKAQVLPTNGLRVVFSDFVEKLRKYDKCMLFGHEYSSLKEFLSVATLQNNHVMFNICANDRSPNTPLIDCERDFGLKNKVRELPENKNRLLYMPNKAVIYFGRTSIYFDNLTGLQALISLGDLVTDIWMDPPNRTEGWDIVYDKMRGINPDKVVPVITVDDMKKYPVLKENQVQAKSKSIH